MKTAAARPEPIPVFAEMSSINPVFVLPGALATPEPAVSLAEAFVGSLTGLGPALHQSPGCSSPRRVKQATPLSAAAAALSPLSRADHAHLGIAESWRCRHHADLQLSGRRRARGTRRTRRHHRERPGSPPCSAPTWHNFTATHELQEEIFGAAGLFVRYSGERRPACGHPKACEGQLTATVQLTAEDYGNRGRPAARPGAQGGPDPLQRLAHRRRGQATPWSTAAPSRPPPTHAPPPSARWPSTASCARSATRTSPDELLPEPLQERNPWKLNRRIDGTVLNP